MKFIFVNFTDMLHLQFDQTPELSYDFARHYAKSNRSIKILFGVILLALVLQMINTFSRDGVNPQAAFTVLLPALMIFVLWWWLIPIFTRKQIERADRNHPAGRAREMIFTEEDFTVKTSQSESTFSYAGLLRYDSSDLAYFLYIAANQAILVPRSAMSAEEATTLEALLERNGITRRG